MKNTTDNPDQDWHIVYDSIKDKLHGPWLKIYLIPFVGFLCSPFLGDLLMRNMNAKLIGLGVGLTVVIWAIILIVIQNNPRRVVTDKIGKNVDLDANSPSQNDSTNHKWFLVFPNKQVFDIWHKEVMFRLGLPKYGRRLTTGEIAEKYVVKQYANWKRHLNPLDQRIRCGYDKDLPTDLIDENAKSKYKFINASYSDLEEMGFIKDRPNVVGEEIFNFNVPDMTESTNYITPLIGRSWIISPDYNFEFVLCLYRNVELRNKYLVDLGSIDNKSRISIYLDKEDYLCFRVIDENSKSHILRLHHNLFNKKYQFNFKFAFCPERSYLEAYINGTPVALQYFNFRIPFYYYDNNMMFVGANIDGTYCAKMIMDSGKIFVIKQKKNIPLLSYDSFNVNSMIFNGQEIIVYEDQDIPMNMNKN